MFRFMIPSRGRLSVRLTAIIFLTGLAVSGYASASDDADNTVAASESLPGLEVAALDDNDSPFAHVDTTPRTDDAMPATPASDIAFVPYRLSVAQTLAALESPLDSYHVTSEFGWRNQPLVKASYRIKRKGKTIRKYKYAKPKTPRQQFHMGLDMATSKGAPVHVALDGTIESMGKERGYGNYMRVVHENGVETAYAHMSGFPKGLKVGQPLQTGDVIGFVGSTGRSTGPHVHYEVLVDGVPVDPENRTVLKKL